MYYQGPYVQPSTGMGYLSVNGMHVVQHFNICLNIKNIVNNIHLKLNADKTSNKVVVVVTLTFDIGFPTKRLEKFLVLNH